MSICLSWWEESLKCISSRHRVYYCSVIEILSVRCILFHQEESLDWSLMQNPRLYWLLLKESLMLYWWLNPSCLRSTKSDFVFVLSHSHSMSNTRLMTDTDSSFLLRERTKRSLLFSSNCLSLSLHNNEVGEPFLHQFIQEIYDSVFFARLSNYGNECGKSGVWDLQAM
jgi:hypothetical protein